jgi:hypothetical protein
MKNRRQIGHRNIEKTGGGDRQKIWQLRFDELSGGKCQQRSGQRGEGRKKIHPLRPINASVRLFHKQTPEHPRRLFVNLHPLRQ